MIEYKVDDRHFILHYRELKEKYNEVLSWSDSQFLERLPEVLHVVCIICYLKETPSYNLLSDTGLIHELVHILDQNLPVQQLSDIRQLFKETCKLA